MLCVVFILSSLFVNTLCDNKDGGKAPRILLNDRNTMPSIGLGTFVGFDELCDNKDGGKAPRILLNDRNTMPSIGLGTFVGFDELCDNKDGGKAPRILLNDRNTMPSIGLGTFVGFDEHGTRKPLEREVEDPVTWALGAGYRMIDTASAYLNEEQVGNAVRSSSVPRENIFVVTKLGIDEKRDVVGALRNSLSRLNLTYIDLYLIHNPVSFTPDHSGFDVIDYLDTWKGMEDAKKLGLTKSIGISNFNISQIDRLLANSQTKPAVLQIEVNLNLAQNKLLNYCNNKDIAVMAYTPFGSLFEKNSTAPSPRVNDPVLKRIAEAKGKSVPQVVLRYLVQRGVAPIPKSVKKQRIEENVNIFDFELTSEEMDELSKFNKDYRVVWPTFWQDHPFYSMERSDTPGMDLFGWNQKKD